MRNILVITTSFCLEHVSKNFKDKTMDVITVITLKDLKEEPQKYINYNFVVLQVVYPFTKQVEEDLLMVRKRYQCPVVLLDAYPMFNNKMFAHTHKFDDYLNLSRGIDEVVTRVRYMVISRESDTENLIYKDLILNINQRTCIRAGQYISLRNKQFELLQFFMENTSRILTVQQILEAVWDMNAASNTNTVQSHICQLRKKIDFGFESKLLHTVNCVGYKFE